MVPYGYCHCGCGRKTTISRQNHTKFGWVKGEPKKFILGHTLKRLVYHTEDRGYKTPCWITSRTRIRRNGKSTTAWRFVWEKRNGPVPPGLQLDHLCGQGGYRTKEVCIRPSHIEAVSQVINIQRGRRVKMTPSTVRQMRIMRKNGVQIKDLANLFGISMTQTKRIIYKHGWKNL